LNSGDANIRPGTLTHKVLFPVKAFSGAQVVSTKALLQKFSARTNLKESGGNQGHII
jgi:hypothetical protein